MAPLRPKLTPYESLLYHALAARNGDPLTFEEMERIQVPQVVPHDSHNKFAVHMRSLRIKLGAKIRSVHQVGYILEN